MSENAERRVARKRLQVRYRALYDEVVDILFEIDPIGVHVDNNAEKFVPEATSILARLRDARIAEDVETIVQILLEDLHNESHWVSVRDFVFGFQRYVLPYIPLEQVHRIRADQHAITRAELTHIAQLSRHPEVRSVEDNRTGRRIGAQIERTEDRPI